MWTTVTSIAEYFQTDWAAMTLHDWIGMILTVAVFLLLVWVYLYTFHPKNRERLEAQRHIPLDDENFDTENDHERK